MRAVVVVIAALMLAFAAWGYSGETCFHCDENRPCVNDAACLGDCWCDESGECQPY